MQTPRHTGLSSMGVFCHSEGARGQAPSSRPLSAPRQSPGTVLLAACQPFFITWQGPNPRLSLADSEGCWWVLNCLKVIKSSWVDILNRTFIASVNLWNQMPRQTFSEFIALFCVSSPSAPAFPALKRRCWRHGHLWPQTQPLANGPKLCNVSLKFHFFFSLGYSSSSL